MEHASMAILLVTYDLNREGQRPNIVDAVKNVGTSWARLSESSYAIETIKTPEQVYAELSKLIDDNDYLFVITLKRPYFGYGPKDVIDWLDKRLTY